MLMLADLVDDPRLARHELRAGKGAQGPPPGGPAPVEDDSDAGSAQAESVSSRQAGSVAGSRRQTGRNPMSGAATGHAHGGSARRRALPHQVSARWRRILEAGAAVRTPVAASPPASPPGS
jgi:hypothetical protein